MELGQCLACGLNVQTVGIELEVGVELGDGLFALLHLLGYLREGEVCVGIVGLSLYGIFGSKVGGVEISPVFVEFSDSKVFSSTVFGSLNLLDFG